ncbi:MAG: molybdenum cofactor biosynthesis protein MoaE [Nocardioidaceae bacterium]
MRAPASEAAAGAPDGRQHEVVRISRIRADSIDPNQVIQSVQDPRAGAVDIFLGTVRNHDGGQAVVDLDYHAHTSAEFEL